MRKKFIGISYGSSMNPLIQAGDKLFVAESKKIVIGDIVVFIRGKKLISHRLIRFKKEFLVTKGDNSIFTDGLIRRDEIIGKVVLVQSGEKILNFEGKKANAVRYYFLLRSLLLYYSPILTYKLLNKLLFGVNFMKNALSEKL